MTAQGVNVSMSIITLNSLKSQLDSAMRRTSSSSGCYIATMVYGDYDEPQVMVLRDFRDGYFVIMCLVAYQSGSTTDIPRHG